MYPKARRAGLLVTEVDDQSVIYDRVTFRAHNLNPVATFVWRNADGETAVEDIADAMSEQMGVTGAYELVLLALKRLEYASLLASKDPILSRLTRRGLATRPA